MKTRNIFVSDNLGVSLHYRVRCHNIEHVLYPSIIGLTLDSSSWSMVRGKDYMGNLSQIQDRFLKGKYKGGPDRLNGKAI